MATPHCVHNGNSTGDNEFNSYVFYVLVLIKAYSILVAHTNHMVLLSPLPWLVMSGKMEGSIRAQVF